MPDAIIPSPDTASVEKNKVKMATLGKRALQHKAAGYEGRGEGVSAQAVALLSC